MSNLLSIIIDRELSKINPMASIQDHLDHVGEPQTEHCAVKPAVGSSDSTASANEGLSLLFAASLVHAKEPSQFDVLCGRGGAINKHVGNRMYRRVVEHNKAIYRDMPKRYRVLVGESIVQCIRNNGGRFLHSGKSGEWKEISFRKAVAKTSQALREKIDPRENDKGNDDGDEEDESSSPEDDELTS